MQKKKLSKVVAAMLAASCMVLPVQALAAGAAVDYAKLYAGVDYQNKTTCVIGPESQNMDSVGATIGYAYLKSKLGMATEPRVAAPLNRDMSYMLEYFHIPQPAVMNDAAGQQVILVDHSSYAAAINGMKKARIVEVIDRHNLGGLESGGFVYYRNIPTAATSSIVYLSFKETGVEVPKAIAGVLFAGVMSATDNLQGSNVTALDRQAYDELKGIAGVKDISVFHKELEKAAFTHEGMSDKEIFETDCKDYVVKDWAMTISQLECLNDEEFSQMKSRMLAYMNKIPDRNAGMLYFLVLKNRSTGAAELLYTGTMAEAVAKKAFAGADANHAVLKNNADRKRDVEPAIRTELERYMQY